MRFLPVRDDALLIELDDLETTLALFDSLSSDPIAGTGEMIPGARTLLVSYRPSAVSPEQIVAAACWRELGGRVAGAGSLVEIPVTYNGEDLDEVAGLLGISSADVVRLHTAQEYAVGFTGFAPGFAYLSGGHPDLDVPRRSSPRTRIPAGSVALAGTFSGVYPRESPGGWQLIGTTEAQMWDLSRERPALLLPGDRVRFIDVSGSAAPIAQRGSSEQTESSGQTETSASIHAPAEPDVAHALEISAPGMLALLQDLGRPGYASMGVSSSGALDAVSLREANRLVGNATATACLELTFGGFRMRARGEHVIALTGAPVPLTVTSPAASDGTPPFTRSVDFGRPFALSTGEELVVGAPTSGIRTYLAVRGGFDLEPVLGSLSTDVLAVLGPDPVVAGMVLPVGTASRGITAVTLTDTLPETVPGAASDHVHVSDQAASDKASANPANPADVVLDVVLGPRTDWFSPDAVESLCAQSWAVSSRSNRVGLRLEGESLTRVIDAELPSEGTVSGAIQIPPNGQPVLFLADHPLTGGYPVIGSVATYHLPRAGQLPPGARIRFRPIGPFAEYREVQS
jgi:KipI family sensor histidine kinase inhibitor